MIVKTEDLSVNSNVGVYVKYEQYIFFKSLSFYKLLKRFS